MDRSDVVTLINVSVSADSIGQMVTSEEENTVFCRASSVTSSEWFAGGQAGMNPECRLTIFAGDYNGEKICSFHGRRYSIYRTYLAQTDRMELYLDSRVGKTYG